MSTATNDTTNKKWTISTDLGTITTSDVSKTVTLATAGTYIDKNIEITATAEKPSAATLGASATGSATISSVSVGTKSGSNYPVTGSASISGTASASTTTSGYAIKDSTTGTGSTSGTASLNATIPAAAATVKFTGEATTPTVAIDADSDNILASAATATKPSSGYYAAVKATAPATTLSATTKTVGTAGYLGAADEITASAATTAKTGADYYVPITAGSVSASNYNSTSQTGTDLTGYAEQTVTVPSEGSLVLSEGYYPKTFITLDAMLDGKTDTAGTGTGDLKNGYVAYDVNGKKLSGTLAQLTSTNFSINATSLGGSTATFSGPTYNSSKGNFDISTSGSVSKTITVSASKEGWVANGENAYSDTIESGTVSAATTLAKIALTATKTSGNLTVAPTLARTAKPSADTWTDAASGSATTTKPTSGAYVQIDAAAATNTLTVKPQVGTAGYGTTTDGQYGYTEYSASVGAAKATTAYIPITAGSASVTGNSALTINASDPTLNSSTGKYDISLTVPSTTISASVSKTGWISSVSSASVSGSATKSLTAAALTHSNTAEETKVAVGASGSRSSNLAAPGSDTTYYVTVNASQTAAGSVTHAASVSTGFVPTDGLSEDATISTSANVTGNGTKVYLKSTAITGSIAGTISDTTYSTSGILTSAPSSGVYIDFAGNGSATSGAVYTGTATAAHAYVKVYTGDYTVA